MAGHPDDDVDREDLRDYEPEITPDPADADRHLAAMERRYIDARERELP